MRSHPALNGPGEIAGPLATSPLKRTSEFALKTYAALAVMVILGPTGNVLLSTGMREATGPTQRTAASMVEIAARVVSSSTIWLGFACLIAYVIAEMVVLSWADYSFVQPASAASYGVVALLGSAVLGEDVSPTHWLGVAVICLGVLVVGHTSPRTTEPHHRE